MTDAELFEAWWAETEATRNRDEDRTNAESAFLAGARARRKVHTEWETELLSDDTMGSWVE